MFGGMGGGRGGMSSFRIARVVLLLGFLLLVLTLHGRGSTYNTLHVVYIVLLVALLLGSLVVSRRRGTMGRRGPGGQRRGPMAGGGSFGSPPPPAAPQRVRDNPDPEADEPSGPSPS
jgi:hypothetical protein